MMECVHELGFYYSNRISGRKKVVCLHFLSWDIMWICSDKFSENKNKKADVTCHIDRNLITGASPVASNKLGRLLRRKRYWRLSVNLQTTQGVFQTFMCFAELVNLGSKHPSWRLLLSFGGIRRFFKSALLYFLQCLFDFQELIGAAL